MTLTRILKTIPLLYLVLWLTACAQMSKSGYPIVRKDRGSLVCRGPEADGKPHELWECVGPRKNISSRIHYRFGKRDGVAHLYFDDGKLDTVTDWKDGYMHGIFRSYYKSGKLNFESEYANGYLNGTLREWDENGILIARFLYKAGVPDGLSQEWHSNGNLKSHFYFTNGAPAGQGTEWREDGRLKRRTEYAPAAQPKVRTFSADGHPE